MNAVTLCYLIRRPISSTFWFLIFSSFGVRCRQWRNWAKCLNQQQGLIWLICCQTKYIWSVYNIFFCLSLAPKWEMISFNGSPFSSLTLSQLAYVTFHYPPPPSYRLLPFFLIRLLSPFPCYRISWTMDSALFTPLSPWNQWWSSFCLNDIINT